MQTTIPDVAADMIARALELAPQTTPLMTFRQTPELPVLIRQLGVIAGIASVLRLSETHAPAWRGVEAVALLTSRAVENHLSGDNGCAYRMLLLAEAQLDQMAGGAA